MRKTTIHLPKALRDRAERRAHQLGISLGELVRRALTALLAQAGPYGGRDPFFADEAVYAGPVPPGASVRHDDHLQGW